MIMFCRLFGKLEDWLVIAFRRLSYRSFMVSVSHMKLIKDLYSLFWNVWYLENIRLEYIQRWSGQVSDISPLL